eukprot:SAG22_NODE_2056_length_3069_cov_2.477778_2_plen_738_part_00
MADPDRVSFVAGAAPGGGQPLLSATFSAKVARHFQVAERGSTLGTEFKAGFINFLANSYLMVVIPQMMQHGGIDPHTAITGFVLGTFVGSCLIGLLANIPVPAGPGLGCAAFYAYGLVFNLETNWEERWEGFFDPASRDAVSPEMVRQALTVCLVASFITLLLGVCNLSSMLYDKIPGSVKNAMPVGLGLLLALNGFQSMQLVVPDSVTGVAVGDLASAEVWLGGGGEAAMQLQLRLGRPASAARHHRHHRARSAHAHTPPGQCIAIAAARRHPRLTRRARCMPPTVPVAGCVLLAYLMKYMGATAYGIPLLLLAAIGWLLAEPLHLDSVTVPTKLVAAPSFRQAVFMFDFGSLGLNSLGPIAALYIIKLFDIAAITDAVCGLSDHLSDPAAAKIKTAAAAAAAAPPPPPSPVERLEAGGGGDGGGGSSRCPKEPHSPEPRPALTETPACHLTSCAVLGRCCVPLSARQAAGRAAPGGGRPVSRLCLTCSCPPPPPPPAPPPPPRARPPRCACLLTGAPNPPICSGQTTMQVRPAGRRGGRGGQLGRPAGRGRRAAGRGGRGRWPGAAGGVGAGPGVRSLRRGVVGFGLLWLHPGHRLRRVLCRGAGRRPDRARPDCDGLLLPGGWGRRPARPGKRERERERPRESTPPTPYRASCLDRRLLCNPAPCSALIIDCRRRLQVLWPFYPVLTAVPLFASAPILVNLGLSLIHLIQFLDFEDPVNGLPSFFTIAVRRRPS